MSTKTARDSDSVYRVVKLIATHPESWEAAASSAIEDATKTIPDLRVARVLQMDTLVKDSKVDAYRVALSISYRIDRNRMTAAGEAQVVRRYLVVANRTLGGAALKTAIADRMAQGPTEVHVVVPVLPSVARIALSLDPVSPGYVMSDPTVLAEAERESAAEARDRLAAQLDELKDAGASATGEVGSADPLVAIGSVLARSSFDEIVLCTLPASGSKWIKMDLPSRVQRRFNLPVTVVEGES
ncbi:MAG: dodecin family protein [Acidimicrobiia bacterium]